MKTYATLERAERRARYLVRNYGIWPGILKCEDGRYRLSCNPDDHELQPMILI